LRGSEQREKFFPKNRGKVFSVSELPARLASYTPKKSADFFKGKGHAPAKQKSAICGGLIGVRLGVTG
jgi:hypothetical protein